MDMRGEEWRDIDWKIEIKGYYDNRSHVISQLRNLTMLGDKWAANELSLAKGEGKSSPQKEVCEFELVMFSSRSSN